MRGARPWGSGRAAASQPVGAGLGGWRDDVQSGHFRRRFRCVCGRKRRGAYRWDRVGCTRGNGAHPWREVTPSRGWRHGRSAPRLRTTASGRRGGLNSSVVYSRERSPTLTVSETCPFTNQGDANVRFFIRVRFCTVYLVIKLSPRNALLRVGALSSCLDLLRRGQSVRRVCGDPETCGLLRRNSRCRECTRA